LLTVPPQWLTLRGIADGNDSEPRRETAVPEVARSELTPLVGSQTSLACDDHIAPHPFNEPGRTTRNRSVIVQNTELASDTPIKHSPAIGAPPIIRIFRLDTDEATA
jgi:hypothetical protein